MAVHNLQVGEDPVAAAFQGLGLAIRLVPGCTWFDVFEIEHFLAACARNGWVLRKCSPAGEAESLSVKEEEGGGT